MMKYQGVIFDLDGVICHTDHFHFLAWKQLADRLGIYFDEQVNNRLRGVSRMESLVIVLENSPNSYTDAEMEEFAEEKNKYYRRYLSQMSPADLSSQVKDTLGTLKKSGCRIAVGSSSKNAGYILERIGLNDFFDAVVEGNQIQHSKPDPEVFLLAAKQLGLSPENCLVVEDAFAGIEAAKRGGFDAAGIGQAQTCESADYHISEIQQIVSIIAEGNINRNRTVM